MIAPLANATAIIIICVRVVRLIREIMPCQTGSGESKSGWPNRKRYGDPTDPAPAHQCLARDYGAAFQSSAGSMTDRGPAPFNHARASLLPCRYASQNAVESARITR